MTILSRYILREVLKIFTIAFSGVMTIYLTIDFFEKLRRFLDYDARASDILFYFLLRVPEIAFQMAPVAVLVACLLSVGLLSRTNEITAMRSCGISLFRVVLPLLGFAFAVAGLLFFVGAIVMPLAMAKAELVRIVQIEGRHPSTALKSKGVWVQADENTLMQIDAVDPGGATLRGVRLYQVDSAFRLRRVLEGREARYTGQGWVLYSGHERLLLLDGRTETETFDVRSLKLGRIPEDFSTWLALESKYMTLPDLRAYVDRLRMHGYSFFRYLTDYHDRMAFSFVSVVMAVVGIALSLRLTGVRGAGLAVGIGQAFGVAFLYWMTRSVAVALGHSGVMLPILAGWFTNLLFLSFGFYLLLRVRY